MLGKMPGHDFYSIDCEWTLTAVADAVMKSPDSFFC
jgi:hypothetical protein